MHWNGPERDSGHNRTGEHLGWVCEQHERRGAIRTATGKHAHHKRHSAPREHHTLLHLQPERQQHHHCKRNMGFRAMHMKLF